MQARTSDGSAVSRFRPMRSTHHCKFCVSEPDTGGRYRTLCRRGPEAALVRSVERSGVLGVRLQNEKLVRSRAEARTGRRALKPAWARSVPICSPANRFRGVTFLQGRKDDPAQVAAVRSSRLTCAGRLILDSPILHQSKITGNASDSMTANNQDDRARLLIFHTRCSGSGQVQATIPS